MASLSCVSNVVSGLCAIAVAVTGMFAAAVPSRAETTIEPGVDRPGADLNSFDLPQADPALCRQACEEQAACKAYTYVKPGVQAPNARCWLKSSVPPATPNSCCISGVKLSPGRLPPQRIEPPPPPPKGAAALIKKFINIRDVDDAQVSAALKASIYDSKPHVRVGTPQYPKPGAKIVAIRVATLDRPVIPAVKAEVVQAMFSIPCGIGGYFRDNSGFKFVPDHVVPPWVVLGKTLSSYVTKVLKSPGEINVLSDGESWPEMKRDVLKLADVDWASIDINHDKKITSSEAVLVFLMANHTGPKNDWGSTRNPPIGSVATPSGVWDFGSERLINYTVNPSNGGAAWNPSTYFRDPGSTLAHELFHAWFGLVDRYHGWAGDQDIMASHGDWKHATLYDKMMVGWASPKFVTPSTANRIFTFDIQTKKPEGLVLIDPSRPKEYWIIERRPVYSNCGFENGLPAPADGFAVYWVNRKAFFVNHWPGVDDMRLVDAGEPDQDPDGSGPAQKKSDGTILDDATQGFIPGYDTPGHTAFFRTSTAARRLYFGDGTKSPFSLTVMSNSQIAILSH